MNDNPNPERLQEQWIQDYLAGRLSAVESEAFEARFLSDDALGDELERAIEIRAALNAGGAFVDPPSTRDSEDSGDEVAIQQYLSGKLAGPAADAFEQRLLADDRLSIELQRALEIRAARKADTQTIRARAPAMRTVIPLALAASAAMLFAGWYWLTPQSEVRPVFRGAEQRMHLDIEPVGADLRARWDTVPGAARYELLVLASEGGLLRSIETQSVAMTVELAASSASDAATRPAFIEVVALDEFGQTITRSQRVAVPAIP